jgi:hypothetical protein
LTLFTPLHHHLQWVSITNFLYRNLPLIYQKIFVLNFFDFPTWLIEDGLLMNIQSFGHWSIAWLINDIVDKIIGSITNIINILLYIVEIIFNYNELSMVKFSYYPGIFEKIYFLFIYQDNKSITWHHDFLLVYFINSTESYVSLWKLHFLLYFNIF